MKAVIMAGGRGTRLLPYTTVFPKPLMPLGDRAVLDVVLRQLAHNGFEEVVLAVGHLAELVMAYVGDGRRLGLRVRYQREDSPLGTAGPLACIDELQERFLVMNGDVLADIDFNALVQAHNASGATATVVLARRTVRVDLGVIERDGEGWINGYSEKPTFDFAASAGMYVMEPSIREFIPRGQRFDLPDLVLALIRAKAKVWGYVHEGYWLDIGRPDDYERAQNDFEHFRKAIFERPRS